MCFEDHGMGGDLTSTKALLSPSIPLLHWHVFYFLFHSFSVSFPLFLSGYPFFSPHTPLSFTLLSLFTILSLHSLLHCLCLLSLFVSSSFFFLFSRSPSGSWSASWSTPGAAPWEEVVTTACASSSRPGSAQRPPGSPVDWWRDTNWHRLLRWWKEKAWPAGWLKSARQELSSSGNSFFLVVKAHQYCCSLLNCLVSFTFLRWLDISFLLLLAIAISSHLRLYLKVWMCVCACWRCDSCCLMCSCSVIVAMCSPSSIKSSCVCLWQSKGNFTNECKLCKSVDCGEKKGKVYMCSCFSFIYIPTIRQEVRQKQQNL